MKKSYYVIIGAVIAVILLAYGMYAVVASPTVSAQLLVQEGVVHLDQGNGYQPVTGQMELSAQDKIKTLDGEATVILHESIVVDLEPNTELVIDDLSQEYPKLSQPSGDTWTKFAKITGVESLDIATPVTVATVRGTFFSLRQDRALLSEGDLDVTVGGNTLRLSGLQKATVQGGVPTLGQVNADDMSSISKRKHKIIKRLMTLREMELKKHKTVLKLIKKRYNMDAQQVMAKLEELDENTVNLDEIEKQAPINLKAMAKIKRITQEIRTLKKQLSDAPHSDVSSQPAVSG